MLLLSKIVAMVVTPLIVACVFATPAIRALRTGIFTAHVESTYHSVRSVLIDMHVWRYRKPLEFWIAVSGCLLVAAVFIAFACFDIYFLASARSSAS